MFGSFAKKEHWVFMMAFNGLGMSLVPNLRCFGSFAKKEHWVFVVAFNGLGMSLVYQI